MERLTKYFGTDGIRGRVGESLITPEFVLKLGWAAGKALGNGSSGKILIGKDTRISGYMLESALEAGLSAAGMEIGLLGPMPTPGIAYLTRALRASAGIVISASHNLYYDNGIKFFSSDGKKLSKSSELEIEDYLDAEMRMIGSAQLGKAKRVSDARGRYIEFCKSTIPFGVRLKGLKIVVDCASGATYHIAPDVFRELGAEVIEIGTHPDGLNINDGCGSVYPELLKQQVITQDAHLGIAFDGDGDRVIMVDACGEIVDGDEILFIIANDLAKKNDLCGGVVGTVMTNWGCEQALRNLGVPFERTAVGDRYVMQALVKNGWLLGGESSGHIVNLSVTTTGDGIISALQVLRVIVETGKSLSELRNGMTKLPSRLVNLPISQGIDIDSHPTIQAAIKSAEGQLGAKGRLLVRLSGTEPLLRIMVEGMDASLVDNTLKLLTDSIRQAVTK